MYICIYFFFITIYRTRTVETIVLHLKNLLTLLLCVVHCFLCASLYDLFFFVLSIKKLTITAILMCGTRTCNR